ncbi:hypothetical protein BJ742DRAFT_671644, partial [Cladochytrium replicatum]
LTEFHFIEEARSLQRCKRASLDTPLYLLDVEGAIFYMEDVPGRTVRDTLGYSGDRPLSQQIGKSVALMYNLDVIHGDLTTSNTMVIIDFGLSFVSTLQEDKAEDLHVLERALSSTQQASENPVKSKNSSVWFRYLNFKNLLHKQMLS